MYFVMLDTCDLIIHVITVYLFKCFALRTGGFITGNYGSIVAGDG